ncbi:MAG: helix-turn-helix domain-containing protein [Pseudonocardiaceae bacterium]
MEWTAVGIRRFREVGLCLSQDEFARVLGFAKRTIGNAERSTHPPSLALRRALDHALEKASEAQRDRFLAAPPAQPGAVPAIQQTTNPTLEADPTLESVELLRRAEASELGTGALEQLEELVERLGIDYFAVPPAEFRQTALSWRRYVVRLLAGTMTLRERRRLYAVAGWLSGLIAEASLALGDHAEPHCATALALAQDIGDARLAGWVRGTQAQIALYAGDPRDAVAFAQAGRQVAPAGSAALVRSCTHEARASARIGDRKGTQTGLDAAEHAWNILSQPLARSIYSLGKSYLPYCAATCFVWLCDPVNARMWVSQSVDLTGSKPGPTVGHATTRIDLAIALAQDSELEEASATGLEALDICAQRLTLPARRRIEELLAALRPFNEPCVVELRERWLWISS